MARPVALGIAGVRTVVGMTLLVLPVAGLEALVGEPASGPLVLMSRTVGGRDLVLGAGTLAALRAGSPGEVRGWVRAGVASDALDVALAMATLRRVGRARAVVAAALAVPVLAAGIGVLAQPPDSFVRPAR